MRESHLSIKDSNKKQDASQRDRAESDATVLEYFVYVEDGLLTSQTMDLEDTACAISQFSSREPSRDATIYPEK